MSSALQTDLIPEKHRLAFPNLIFFAHFYICVFLKLKGSCVVSEGIVSFLRMIWLGKVQLSIVEQIKAMVGPGRAYLYCPCLRVQHCRDQHSGHVWTTLCPGPQATVSPYYSLLTGE